MPIRTPALAWVLMILAGCEGGDASPGGAAASSPPEVRDSASVAIVTNEAPQRTGDRAWRLSDEPVAVYGYDPVGEAGVGQGGWAQVLSGGRVAAIDYTTNEIRIFSPDGLVDVLGGAGEGPGEFQSVSQFWRLPGDTVLAYDRGLHRVTRFSGDGTFERVVAIDADSVPFPRPLGALPDGRYVGVTRIAPVWGAPDGTVTAQDETFYLLNADGEQERAIAQEQGDRAQMGTDPQGRRFSRPALDGFAPAAVSTVGNGHLYHGFSERDEIRVVDPDGGLVRIIRRTEAAEPVTRDMIQAQEDRQRQAYEERDPAGLPDLERRLSEAEYGEHVPFFDWLLVDDVGNLWVRDYFIPGGTNATYSVFDEAGTWITEVEVPDVGRPAVFDIGDDYVLVRQQDDLGIQSYARYGLIKPEA